MKQLLAGKFRDGPFICLNYQTPSQKGVTDQNGRFYYEEGELITFSIGSLTIGVAIGSASLTIASLHNSSYEKMQDLEPTCAETNNRARFLQSLGRDVDLRSGVMIDDATRNVVNTHAKGIQFLSSIEEFEKAPAVCDVFRELGLRLRGAAEARNHLRRALQGIRVLRDVRIPTRDGSHLVTDVFLPIAEGTYPVLLRQSVYGRAFQIGSVHNEAEMLASEEREAAWFEKSTEEINYYFRHSETAVSANSSAWVPQGYVVVRVDGRGVGKTPGSLNPFSQQEALDYYDAIEGQLNRPGWNVAALQPPSLYAMAAMASDADAYRDLAYPGGIFLENYRRWWWKDTVGPARNKNSDAVDFIAGLENHPWDDGHYHGHGQDAILSADFSNIHIPVITAVSQTGFIHGRAGFEAFVELPSPTKQLLILDAAYPEYMFVDCQPDIEAFFSQHLKGIVPSQEQSPVRMIMRTGDGAFEWQNATTWPLPNTEYRELFLNANSATTIGNITAHVPLQEGQFTYSADVQAAKDLPMAVFESGPLTESLELAGHFRATLWVASTSADADVFVAIRVLEGDKEVHYQTRAPGTRAPLTYGCLKVSHRATDPARSNKARPWHTHREEDALPLSPNTAVKIDVELLAATGRIPLGSRLRVEISPVEGPGEIPGWERAYDESYHRGAANSIFTGGLYASSITIPVISGERKGSYSEMND
ncbi:Alpha/Beta hydrolase protein [Trichoderma velutinum]